MLNQIQKTAHNKGSTAFSHTDCILSPADMSPIIMDIHLPRSLREPPDCQILSHSLSLF